MRKRLIQLSIIALALGAFALHAPAAHALSGSDFNPGRIIDDSVFFNKDAMSVNDIQSFLQSKVPSCDTNHASGSSSYSPPWTCLYQYRENTTTHANNIGNPSSNPSGSISAAQIIYDAAQAYNISPKVLLVLLQKEQSLITDTWPYPSQYRSATGYGCPDGAACDSQYYGFYNQVTKAAYQFRRYATYPDHYNYRSGQNNNIPYNPNGGCGYKTVYIQNQATAGLYNYTPYVPNTAALNNLYGLGDGCSAYGNRNFWRLYNDWFGSPTAPQYAWEYAGQSSSAGYGVVATKKSTWTVYAKNVGTETWSNTGSHPVRLGTTHSMDRSSAFCTDSWASCNRAATLNEASVAPGETGSFTFETQAPTTAGSYKEYFNLVAEGAAWMNDIGLYWGVSVSSASYAYTVTSNTMPSSLSPGETASVVVQVRNDSNVSWYRNGRNPIDMGTASPYDRHSAFIGDDWLSNNRPARSGISLDPGQTTTFSFTLKAPTNSGVYNETFSLVAEGYKWFGQTFSKSITVGSGGSTPTNIMESGSSLTSGQTIRSQDSRYRLVMQTDGNLVLYSPNRPIWWTGTNGKPADRLSVQGDGNMVLYGPGKYYWATWTQGKGAVHLVVQNDGNLVLYDTNNRPVWNSRTAGKI